MFTWRSECHAISALLCGKRCFSLFSLYVLECPLPSLENRYLSALFIHPHSKMCYKSASLALFCTYLISNLLRRWASLWEGAELSVCLSGVFLVFPVAGLRSSCWICWEFSSFSSRQWEWIFHHRCRRVLDTGKLYTWSILTGKINKSN